MSSIIILIIHVLTDVSRKKGFKMKKKFSKFISTVLLSSMLMTAAALPSQAANLIDLSTIAVTNEKYDSGVYITCKTNKNAVLYTQGETVTFTLALWDKNGKKIAAPGFTYTITGDAGKEYGTNGFVQTDANGDATITAITMNQSGYVRLVADVCDKNGKPLNQYRYMSSKPLFQGGVLVDAQNISTTAEIPEDFEEVWKGQLELLDACAPDLVRIEKIDSYKTSAGVVKTQEKDYPNVDIYAIYVDCIGDPTHITRPAGNTNEGPDSGATFAAAYMTVPKNAAPGSLDVNFGFIGYGIQTVFPSTWSTTSICVNVLAHSLYLMPNMTNSEFRTHYSGWVSGGSNYGFNATQNAKLETTYQRGTLLRDAQTLRFILKAFGQEGGAMAKDFTSETMTREEVQACFDSWKGLYKEGNKIDANGGSQGGFMAIGLAALCPQVTSCTATSSWMCDTHGNTDEDKIHSTLRPAAGDGIIYCDTANLATLIKCPTTLTGGLGDTTCPPTGIMALYNNIVRGKDVPAGHFNITFRQGKTHDGGSDIKDNSTYKKADYSYLFETPIETFIDDWTLEDGTLTVKGSGVLAFPDDEAPWLGKRRQIKKIVLDGDFISIGAYALDLSGCSGVEIQIPISVQNIAESAFNTDPAGLTLLVEPASYAADYAKAMNIKFKVLKAETPDDTTAKPDEDTTPDTTPVQTDDKPDNTPDTDNTSDSGNGKAKKSSLPIIIGAAAAAVVAAGVAVLAVFKKKKK